MENPAESLIALFVTQSVRRARFCVAAVVATFAVAGCAQAPASAPHTPAPDAPFEVVAPAAPQAHAPNVAVRDLLLAFVPAAGDSSAEEMSSVMRDALVREGFGLVADSRSPSDGRLEVTVTPAGASAEGSPGQISVAVRRGTDNVELLSSPISSTSAAAAEDVAARLAASPRVWAFAATVKTERDRLRLAAQIMMAPSGGPGDARPSDEDSWREAAARRCRNPKTADACDELAAYIQKFPDGRYAAKAKAVIDLSAHRIDQLRSHAP